jgi:hypothetical protein
MHELPIIFFPKGLAIAGSHILAGRENLQHRMSEKDENEKEYKKRSPVANQPPSWHWFNTNA